MGYSTDFFGSITLSRELTDVEENYINKFSETRRMKRDVNKLMDVYKGEFGYPGVDKNSEPALIYGNEGEYFVGDNENDGTVINYNLPPGHLPITDTFLNYPNDGGDWKERFVKQKEMILNGECTPGLWCQWIIVDNELIWDGGEKFYYYVEWLQYLINHFFSKWDVLLNGEIEWQGEDRDDFGQIVVTDNVIKVLTGKKVYE
jgi:hypothetical protein